MEHLKKEVERLQAQLSSMTPNTMGYQLVQMELAEKQAFIASLERLA